jgi:hypothetical protein
LTAVDSNVRAERAEIQISSPGFAGKGLCRQKFGQQQANEDRETFPEEHRLASAVSAASAQILAESPVQLKK